MSCRRVLSSTPLLVRGSETVGGSGERKLTNWDCFRQSLVSRFKDAPTVLFFN
jgi:hypothetical protein